MKNLLLLLAATTSLVLVDTVNAADEWVPGKHGRMVPRGDARARYPEHRVALAPAVAAPAAAAPAVAAPAVAAPAVAAPAVAAPELVPGNHGRMVPRGDARARYAQHQQPPLHPDDVAALNDPAVQYLQEQLLQPRQPDRVVPFGLETAQELARVLRARREAQPAQPAQPADDQPVVVQPAPAPAAPVAPPPPAPRQAAPAPVAAPAPAPAAPAPIAAPAPAPVAAPAPAPAAPAPAPAPAVPDAPAPAPAVPDAPAPAAPAPAVPDAPAPAAPAPAVPDAPAPAAPAPAAPAAMNITQEQLNQAAELIGQMRENDATPDAFDVRNQGTWTDMIGEQQPVGPYTLAEIRDSQDNDLIDRINQAVNAYIRANANN